MGRYGDYCRKQAQRYIDAEKNIPSYGKLCRNVAGSPCAGDMNGVMAVCYKAAGKVCDWFGW